MLRGARSVAAELKAFWRRLSCDSRRLSAAPCCARQCAVKATSEWTSFMLLQILHLDPVPAASVDRTDARVPAVDVALANRHGAVPGSPTCGQACRRVASTRDHGYRVALHGQGISTRPWIKRRQKAPEEDRVLDRSRYRLSSGGRFVEIMVHLGCVADAGASRL